MWQLTRSRGMFLNAHRMTANRTIWHYLAEAMLDSIESEDAEAYAQISSFEREVATISPGPRSNCPLTDSLLDELIDLAPPKLKPFVQNIYVGLTLSGLAEAESNFRKNAATVEMSVQLLWVIEGLASLFDDLLYRVRQHNERANDRNFDLSAVDPQTLWARWDTLDDAVILWRRAGFIHAGDSELETRIPGRTDAEFGRWCQQAQLFVIGHELGHHLLGHHLKAPHKKLRVSLARTEYAARVPPWIDEFVETFPKAQQEELQCDIFSILLLSGSFVADTQGVDYSKPYGAIGGAALSLLSLTFIDDRWVGESESDTHPSLQSRWTALAKFWRQAWASSPRDRFSGHPIDLLEQLSFFLDVALTRRMRKSFQSLTPPGSVDELALLAADLEARLRRNAATIGLTDKALAPMPPEAKVVTSEGVRSGTRNESAATSLP